MSEIKAPDPTGRTPDRRKLVAVVYADMVGYSRLIGLDDQGTLERLRTLRREVIDPAINEHGGRIVQTGGDSLLIVFDSVDGAVRCAVQVQQLVPILDRNQPPDRAIRFRVGINLGDAIADGTDLHGDAVNVAARLQAECPPGGICVSRSVRDHVRDRLDLAFESIGELALKNIVRPVEAFVLRLDLGAKARWGNDGNRRDALRPRVSARFRPAWIACVGLLLIGIASAIGWLLVRETANIPNPSETPSAAAVGQPLRSAASPPDIGLVNAPRLSVVVLPFNNLGGEGVSDEVVDGITEDLTTDLSRLPNFLVIARNSAFIYKGKPIDIKRVGEELGVRYAVEGSVRKAGSTLRVNVQLVATETGTHLWADRFDVGRDGVGYNVDDIVRQIGTSLNVRLVDIESARSARERPTNQDVTDVLLRARALYNLPPNPQKQAQVVALYEQAVELDPSSGTALAGLAEALMDSLAGPDDPTAPTKFRRAEELIARAELLHPDNRYVILARVLLLGNQSRCQEVIPAALRAIEVQPSLTGTHFRLGVCLMATGRAADAIPEFEQAIRLHPRNPQNFSRYLNIGYAQILIGLYDEAILSFQRSLAANPGSTPRNRGRTHAAIAAAQALAGNSRDAHLSATEASRLWPMLTVRGYIAFGVTDPVFAAQVARMLDGLRLAGVRDHAEEQADSGIASDDILHTNYEAPTPTTAPGARTILTSDLAASIERSVPLVLDTTPWGRSVPGGAGLWGAGIGGSVSDELHDRLRAKMQQLTRGNLNMPVVAMGWNAERFQGRNLALRLVALGYTEVYWYRGGREAWEVAGLPETELSMQEW